MGKFIARCALFLVALAIILEGFFRIVLPATQHPRLAFVEEFQISRFDPDWMASGIRTIGPFCRRQGNWTLNSSGWNSRFEYPPERTVGRPRIAILGDSYIAGFAVDVEKHIDSALFDLLGGTSDVFAFGDPGAPLAHLVGLTRYIDASYAPDIFIIFVSHGAISKSLEQASPFRYRVVEESNGFKLAPPQRSYVSNRLGRFVYRSALVRYVLMNRQVPLNSPREGFLGLDQIEGTVDLPIRTCDLALADFLLGEFCKAAPHQRIVFITDAPRGPLYRQTMKPLPRPLDFRLLEQVAAEYPRVQVLGLGDAMWEDFQTNGIRFESPPDPHWNERGHLVAAQALYRFLEPDSPGGD